MRLAMTPLARMPLATALLDSPLAIAAVGGVAITFTAIVFAARRSGASLAALGAVTAITLGLLVVERLVVSPGEQVEAALDALLAAIEANDVAAVLAHIDPAAAKIRADVQSLVPLLRVEAANAGTVQVEVDEAAQPPAAVATFRAFLHGVHVRTAARVGYINQRVDLHWQKRGDQWLVTSYTAYYDDQPIDAVGSARTNRATP